MNKIKITKVSVFDTDKDGKEYKTSKGNKFKKLLVTTDKGTIIDGMIFSSDDPREVWKEGQEVEWEIKSREYQGKEYYSFGFFDKNKQKGKHQLLLDRIEVLEKLVFNSPKGVPSEMPIINPPEDQLDLSDIPL